MRNILNRIGYFACNIVTVIFSILFVKSKKVVVIGAWMGTKFADNSRYLYQFLVESKNKYNLSHIVWATRSKELKNQLEQYGYEVVLVGTIKSFFYHCRAGYHIICNYYGGGKKMKSDIDTRFSSLAKKIQLWHGNGIKCVPGKRKQCNDFVWFIDKISSKGCWIVDNYFLLCKSDIDVVFFERKFGARKEYCIDSAYPRTQKCLKYMAEEIVVLNKLKKYNKIILYLPTFRDSYSNFIHPLSNSKVCTFLESNNYLWIEKPHSADINSQSVTDIKCDTIISLNSSFDINILMPHIDILITDYSSAMLDALFFRKQILYYVPDYDYYIRDDRGFLMDYDSVCINNKITDINFFIDELKNLINKDGYNDRSESIRKMFWKHEDWNYDDIWKSIIQG